MAQKGSNHEKNRGKKSPDTLSLSEKKCYLSCDITVGGEYVCTLYREEPKSTNHLFILILLSKQTKGFNGLTSKARIEEKATGHP